MVEEALEPAGVDEVVIVNSHEKPQIERYFERDEALEAYLEAHGKTREAEAIRAAGELPVSYVYQDEALGLGHAVLCASEKMDGDPFFVLLGDYFVPERQMNVRMAEVSAAHGGASVIAVAPVPADQVSRYGIIAGECIGSVDGTPVGEEEPGAVWHVTGLVEKPPVETAPSHLFIVGRYLLSPRVMQLLADVKPGVGGEIQLTDALDAVLREEEMYALIVDPADGFDTGTVESWLETNNVLYQRKYGK